MVGFSETYFSAYALFLGANNFQIGLLTSVPPFLAGISQFATVSLEKRIASRRNIVCFGVFTQLITLIPLFLAYYFTSLRLEIYILLVCLYFASNAIIGPVWNSWMGDLVTPQQRGLYFGRRNRIVTIGTFGSMTVAGFILRYFKEQSKELEGFAILFALALGSRIISLIYLTKKNDPPHHEPAAHPQGFFKFLKDLPKQNFGMLILYMCMLNLAVFVSAAYFTPLMIREYKIDYLTYTAIISATALTKFITFPFWGEMCDKLGARKILNICGTLMAFNLIPWLITQKPIYLFLSQAFTGFVWAGYEISTFIFLLDATKPNERTQITSYLNILVASFGLLGGLIGAAIFQWHPQSMNPFIIVFIISGILRILALLLFGQKLEEVRVIAPVKASEVFLKATGFKSAMGMTSKLVVYGKRKTKKK